MVCVKKKEISLTLLKSHIPKNNVKKYGQKLALIPINCKNNKIQYGQKQLKKSIELFTEFLLRECVDEDNGTCYGNIGKDSSQVRLYNAPWVMLYFTELYKLTNEKRWIELVCRIIRYYYSVGGAKFYPNGIRSVTPGQEAVFYHEDAVIAGGVIDAVYRDDADLAQLIQETVDEGIAHGQ